MTVLNRMIATLLLSVVLMSMACPYAAVAAPGDVAPERGPRTGLNASTKLDGANPTSGATKIGATEEFRSIPGDNDKNEMADGWIANAVTLVARLLDLIIRPAVKYLANYCLALLHNPNIALEHNDTYTLLNRSTTQTYYDIASPDVKRGIIYGFLLNRAIAVCLLLLLLIASIWRYWINGATRAGTSALSAIGRLIAATALIVAWPIISQYYVQISNEMIDYMYRSINPITLDTAINQMANYASKGAAGALLGGAVNSALYSAGWGWSTLGEAASMVGAFFCMLFLGTFIYMAVSFIVMKAVQTGLMLAQYMFAPLFLSFFALPDTESVANNFVRSCLEVSLWTFVWSGLLRILVIVLTSSHTPEPGHLGTTVVPVPWGRFLMTIGILQIMLNVPQFMAKAQISPMSEFINPRTFAGAATGAFTMLGSALSQFVKSAGSAAYEMATKTPEGPKTGNGNPDLKYDTLPKDRPPSDGTPPPPINSPDGGGGNKSSGGATAPDGKDVNNTRPPSKQEASLAKAKSEIDEMLKDGRLRDDVPGDPSLNGRQPQTTAQKAAALKALLDGKATDEQLPTALAALHELQLDEKHPLNRAAAAMNAQKEALAQKHQNAEEMIGALQASGQLDTEQASALLNSKESALAGASTAGAARAAVAKALAAGKIGSTEAENLNNALNGKDGADMIEAQKSAGTIGRADNAAGASIKEALANAEARRALSNQNKATAQSLETGKSISDQEKQLLNEGFDNADKQFDLASQVQALAAEGHIEKKDANTLCAALAGQSSDVQSAAALASDYEDRIPGLRNGVIRGGLLNRMNRARDLVNKAMTSANSKMQDGDAETLLNSFEQPDSAASRAALDRAQNSLSRGDFNQLKNALAHRTTSSALAAADGVRQDASDAGMDAELDAVEHAVETGKDMDLAQEAMARLTGEGVLKAGSSESNQISDGLAAAAARSGIAGRAVLLNRLAGTGTTPAQNARLSRAMAGPSTPEQAMSDFAACTREGLGSDHNADAARRMLSTLEPSSNGQTYSPQQRLAAAQSALQGYVENGTILPSEADAIRQEAASQATDLGDTTAAKMLALSNAFADANLPDAVGKNMESILSGDGPIAGTAPKIDPERTALNQSRREAGIAAGGYDRSLSNAAETAARDYWKAAPDSEQRNAQDRAIDAVANAGKVLDAATARELDRVAEGNQNNSLAIGQAINDAQSTLDDVDRKHLTPETIAAIEEARQGLSEFQKSMQGLQDATSNYHSETTPNSRTSSFGTNPTTPDVDTGGDTTSSNARYLTSSTNLDGAIASRGSSSGGGSSSSGGGTVGGRSSGGSRSAINPVFADNGGTSFGGSDAALLERTVRRLTSNGRDRLSLGTSTSGEPMVGFNNQGEISSCQFSSNLSPEQKAAMLMAIGYANFHDDPQALQAIQRDLYAKGIALPTDATDRENMANYMLHAANEAWEQSKSYVSGGPAGGSFGRYLAAAHGAMTAEKQAEGIHKLLHPGIASSPFNPSYRNSKDICRMAGVPESDAYMEAASHMDRHLPPDVLRDRMEQLVAYGAISSGATGRGFHQELAAADAIAAISDWRAVEKCFEANTPLSAEYRTAAGKVNQRATGTRLGQEMGSLVTYAEKSCAHRNAGADENTRSQNLSNFIEQMPESQVRAAIAVHQHCGSRFLDPGMVDETERLTRERIINDDFVAARVAGNFCAVEHDLQARADNRYQHLPYGAVAGNVHAMIAHCKRQGFTDRELMDPNVADVICKLMKSSDGSSLIGAAAVASSVLSAHGGMTPEDVYVVKAMMDAGWNGRQISKVDISTAADLLKNHIKPGKVEVMQAITPGSRLSAPIKRTGREKA